MSLLTETCQEFEEESNMEVTLDAIFHNLFIRPCPRCRVFILCLFLFNNLI